MLEFLLQGLLVGAAIAAPVGPIGALCIQRSLNEGARAGFVTGLGAAAADAVYGAIAGFGLSAISAWLVGMRDGLALGGGLLLLWFGWRAFRAAPVSAARAAGGSLWRDFLGTFLLTLANPATILSFVALFAGLGLVVGLDPARAASFVAGVFLGSAAWWLLLANLAAASRARVGAGAMTWVNRVSGVLIMGFGVFALSLALRGWLGTT